MPDAEKKLSARTARTGSEAFKIVRFWKTAERKAKGASNESVALSEFQPAIGIWGQAKMQYTIDQVAGLAGFLASDAAASITGAIIPVDGGWTAH